MIHYEIGQLLMEYYDKPCIHKNNMNNQHVAVCIETRDSFVFPLVLKNICDKLGSTWNIHLFLSERVKQRVLSLFPDCEFRFTALNLPPRLPTIEDYSQLVRSTDFWDSIKEEKILMFQSDSYLYHPIPSWVEEYDFIGAPCGLLDPKKVIFNGGLSIRSKKACRSLACDDIDNIDELRPEDIFFTEEMRKRPDKYHLPSIETASRFSTEIVDSSNPNKVIGMHGSDKYYHNSSSSFNIFYNVPRLSIADYKSV